MSDIADIAARTTAAERDRSAGAPAFVRIGNRRQSWECRAELADELLPNGEWSLARWDGRNLVARVKHGPHRTVYRIGTAVGVLYAKQYRVRGWPARLLHLVKRPAARREWSSILAVRAADVPTVEPVACGVVRRGPWIEESWLLTREIPDVVPLDELVERLQDSTDAPDSASEAASGSRRRFAKSVGRLLGRFHAGGFLHDDLHAGNLMVRDATDSGDDDTDLPRMWLLDLHQVRRAPASVEAAGRNLTLFDHFFRNVATTSDRLRFFHAWWDAFHVSHEESARQTAFRDAARRTESLCLAAEPVAHAKRDRKWRRGNRRLIVADGPGVVCRGLAFFGLEKLLEWRDAPEALPTTSEGDAATTGRETNRATNPLVWTGGAAEVRRVRFADCSTEKTDAGGPARHAWEMGHALRRRGIPAVRPLFCIDRSSGGGEALLAVDDGAGGVPAPLESLADCETAVRIGALRIADIMRRLHAAGFVHQTLDVGAFRFRAAAGTTTASTSKCAAPEILLDSPEAVRRVERVRRSDVIQELAALVARVAAPLQIPRSSWARFLRRYVDGGRSWMLTRSDRRRIRDERRRLWRETSNHLATSGDEQKAKMNHEIPIDCYPTGPVPVVK